jgi:hypothetical protein
MQVKVGTYTGNGSSPRTITGVGFYPDIVLLAKPGGDPYIRTNTFVSVESSEIRGGASSVSGITALVSGGFTVGSVFNNNTDVYYYLALRQEATNLKTLSYTGNGADNRSITGAGFMPDMAIVKQLTSSGQNQNGVWRMTPAAVDLSQNFDQTPVADKIQDLDADGIEVGTDNDVNQSSRLHHAIFLKNEAGIFTTFTYAGDGLDNRSINIGMQPDFVYTQNITNSDNGVLRYVNEAAGDSFDTNSGEDVDMIQAFNATGFEVGTDVRVNEAASTYVGFAFKDGAIPAASSRPRSFGRIIG